MAIVRTRLRIVALLETKTEHGLYTMTVLLGLGSNLGDRRAALERALQLLGEHGVRLTRVSPAVESPALLPAGAPSAWNRPFLNIAVECATEAGPGELLTILKGIEASVGRADAPRWAPRPIDLDILLYGDEQIANERLTIPHPGLTVRPFVLASLAAIAPARVIPGTTGMSVLTAYRRLASALPLWMGIVNLTPDSFSDGGRHSDWPAVEATVERMTAAGAGWVDLGAESTRPGATTLTADGEWQRLAPILERVVERTSARRLRPGISVDTYHPEVARRAIDSGADAINDVSGLTDPAMIELAASSPSVDWFAMHHVSIPADPSRTLDEDLSAVDQVDAWLTDRLATWTRAGLDVDRIVFDPGIGFGKTPLQSLELLRGIEQFVRNDLRVLVGHSRKSFMQPIGGDDTHSLDLLTIGASVDLARRGVDVLRVHNVEDHVAAFRGFAHVQRG
jgi:2-amino-4-hydroxy-6-hydroxymethyldihydropteridine diphosphokinase/dihydropteroate synthase